MLLLEVVHESFMWVVAVRRRIVLHGESSKRLATPRNTQKTRNTYNQPNRPNRQTAQPGRCVTTINTAAVHASAQQPTISTHTRQGHHKIFSANAALERVIIEPGHNSSECLRLGGW